VNKALAIAVALLVVALCTLWLRRDDLPVLAPSLVVEQRAAQASAPPPPTAADVASADAAPATSSSTVPDDGADALASAMAERMNRNLGPGFVDYLVEQGLARADAELIVAALARELAGCGFDAMRAQALLQRVAFDDVLHALEAQLNDADGPPVTALLDMEAVAQQEIPCSLAALQRSGISQPAAAQLVQDALKTRSSRRARLP
jgi:hypothetical protein